MPQPRTRRTIGVALLAAIAALGGGLWYARGRGWLKPIDEWVRRTTERGQANRSEGGSMGAMSGTDMGAMGKQGASPGVKGYAEIEVAAEVQERIGVTIGQVEKTASG